MQCGSVRMTAVVAAPDGRRVIRMDVEASTPGDAAEEAARTLLGGGAAEILDALQREA